MNSGYDTSLFLALIPIALINLGLVIWCYKDWKKRDAFNYFNKWTWFFLFVLIQYIGPILYVTIAKKND